MYAEFSENLITGNEMIDSQQGTNRKNEPASGKLREWK